MKFSKTAAMRQMNTTDQLLVQLRNTVIGGNMIPSDAGKLMFSMESAQEHQVLSMESASDNLEVAFESMQNELFSNDRGSLDPRNKLTAAQKIAGAIGGFIGSNPSSLLRKKSLDPIIATEGMVVVNGGSNSDGMSERAFGLEAYDERENRNATIYSIAYNMQSARQDEFGETFFPTITHTPDQVGFGVTIDQLMVFDAVQHKIDGNVTDFQKKYLLRAVADPTILKKEATRVIPAVRPQNLAHFVSPTIVAPATIVVEGQSIITAPLVIGKEMNLIALGQTDSLLATGVMNSTDTLDTAISLKNVYVKFGNDILRFDISNLPLSNFTYTPQSNYRNMMVNFETTSVLINNKTKQADGSALVDLAPIVVGNNVVRLNMKLSGSVNIETGKLSVYGNAVSTNQIQDSTGQILDKTVAPAAAIVAKLDIGTIEGYTVSAFYTNLNRRQRGQLIDVTRFTQLYNIPLRSPIATLHPSVVDSATDSSDVQALITATRIRVSNEAVTALLEATNTLSQYVDAADSVGEGPDILGIGRFLVRPVFYQENLDMDLIVDSLRSAQRAEDMQASLVNKIRDHAYRMHRDSQYQAAANAINGGIAPTPTVIIGTDPVLARYLSLTGELRTLGGEFDVRIVTTLDVRVQGKIFITFGVFNEQRNTAPNPLNFGNMIWSPELVMTTQMSRENTISKETIVQPRYAFITHLPIMTLLTVDKVPDVLNKVKILTA
jgi:hypothetical protein